MRKLKKIRFHGSKNSLNYWHKAKNPLILIYNFILIYIAKYMPSLRLKRILYAMTGMKIGKDAAIGLGVTFDIFFPELIEIGDNTIIGFNSTILTHEFLQEELRVGRVKIGKNVMIGANTTVLPGVEIMDNARISAMSLVNRDVKKNEFVGGVPIRKIG
ncbi:MAG: acyltransferase [Candidatus Micrarchaeota archaeon]|nr:acyltransferase [Candidatus Micrarchaeota archaeon]